MSTLEQVLPRNLGLRVADLARDVWRAVAHGRLDGVAGAADVLEIDDSSRLILLSDTHRGDSSRADVFAPNEGLFLRALGHYYRRGYSYVEVGDGDELWQNRFADVRRAHPRTFELLHAFDRESRLYMLAGNHDLAGGPKDRVEKGSLVAKEGLLLTHRESGRELLAVHGHQVDLPADRMQWLSRFVVRRVWRQLLDRGVATPHGDADAWRRVRALVHRAEGWLRDQFEDRLVEWAQASGKVLICGHTHLAVSAPYGAPPYFNTGSCVAPGVVTGIEIAHGQLTQVRWVARPGGNGSPKAERLLMGLPRPLRHVV